MNAPVDVSYRQDKHRDREWTRLRKAYGAADTKRQNKPQMDQPSRKAMAGKLQTKDEPRMNTN